MNFYDRYVKRTIDFVLSLIALIILIIPLLIIGIIVKLDSPGPMLFKQDRLGKNGKVYKMLKFRSMVVGAEHTGSGVYSGKSDSRVTRVGKILRATSIDELPQLINIIKGDMAIIGFRSPLTYHPWPWDQYTEEQKKMFNVRPGLTGWTQVNGRKTIEWHKRIEMNVWYAEHVSFLLDLKIFFKTIFKVFSNADNENTGATLSG